MESMLRFVVCTGRAIAHTFEHTRYLGGDLEWRVGKLSGYGKYYFDNGIIEQEGGYNDGNFDGLWKVYNDKGLLIRTIQYDKGIKIVESKK